MFQSARPVKGATPIPQSLNLELWEFQSARPVKGATHSVTASDAETVRFNPRAP